MKISEQELSELLSYKQQSNEDIVRYKELIKYQLLKSNKIIYLLNNKELEENEAENDEYFNVNILPYYLIKPTQTDVQNFICYEIQFNEIPRNNPGMKHTEIVFHILCEQKNIVEQKTGIARHDLIAAVLIDMFHGTNIFGNQIVLVSNEPSVVDTDYSARTLVFEQQTNNSLKRLNGTTFNLRS